MNIHSSKFFLGILVITMLTVSCGKKLIYFQQKEETKNTPDQIKIASTPDPASHILQAGDVIQMDYFNRSPELNAMFSSGKSTTSNEIAGMPIDDEGFVFLPVFGKIKLADLTVSQAEKQLTDSLSKYYTDFNFSLKLAGIRVTMLGAIGTKGIQVIPGTNPTIIDAIALGGDLGGVGSPSNIKIFRNTPEGKKTLLLDLSDLDVFRSEGYYLQSNDMIYVETQKRLFVRENIQYINIATSLVNLFTIFIFQFR